MRAIALRSAINTALGSDANEGSCEIAIEDAVEIGMEAGQPLIASNDFLTSPFHDAFLNGRIAALILLSGPRFAFRCQEFGYSDRSGRVIKARCNFRWLAVVDDAVSLDGMRKLMPVCAELGHGLPFWQERRRSGVRPTSS